MRHPPPQTAGLKATGEPVPVPAVARVRVGQGLSGWTVVRGAGRALWLRREALRHLPPTTDGRSATVEPVLA